MKKLLYLFLALIFLSSCAKKQHTDLASAFNNPPEEAKPWVFWYWIKAAVSEEGITADLEAMAENGIGGAYLIPIQSAEEPPLYEPPAEQLTPEWWAMVDHAFKEAQRLGLKFAMHSCDGFAVAGGPWITPEKSMQKIVWSELNVKGNQIINDSLPMPEVVEDYYEDIAVIAYPTPKAAKYNTANITPKVSSNITKSDLSFLTNPENTKEFKTYDEGWIQYEFKEPFMCRSIHINTKGFTYAAHRLIIKTSNDGVHFDSLCRLTPPRHGWQDYEEDITYAIPAAKAKYYRFYYSTEGFEPGSEDMDLARWSPRLKIQGIQLMGQAFIPEYEAKNGIIWRIGTRGDSTQIPDSLCIAIDDMIDVTNRLNSKGQFTWEAPEGDWTILRIGHTSTGHTNYIGGKGLGLECDKFDPQVASFQFDQWFGRVYKELDPQLARDILKVFHIDSWECGSQNWSHVFNHEFKKRRGYNIYPYMAVYTGLPIESAGFSEKVLYDIRKTIDELINENFFKTMAFKAKEKGCKFSSESVAPVMISDAMQHYKQVDIPMGEFWFNSPTHDKPNDILDAISAAWVYDKQIVQSEAFTTLRMDWNEHPGMLKTLLDRNYALGINKLVFHVFTQNPWIDREPGMTMNTVGLYFQRDQTWWKQSKDWIDYIQRSQSLLQKGKPVVDVAVFTGEEYPRRALTPDRLIPVLPGLFGDEKLEKESMRLHNEGAPQLERPYSVKSSKNTFDPANWTDPLRGYKYTSINKDALLKHAHVKDGAIVLPGGQSFRVLVVPGIRKASPNGILSKETIDKILNLVNNGATIILEPMKVTQGGLVDKSISEAACKLYNQDFTETNSGIKMALVGEGRIIQAPYLKESLKSIGIERDVEISEGNRLVTDMAWIHRSGADYDLYFISNQQEKERILDISVRTSDKLPEIYYPERGEIREAQSFEIKNGRTKLTLKFAPNESFFLVLQKSSKENSRANGSNWKKFETITQVNENWTVQFDPQKGGPALPYSMPGLTDWTSTGNDSIIYYSGTASYHNTLEVKKKEQTEYWLNMEQVNHIAEVFVNDTSCGISWTYPYRVNITKALKHGENKLTIEVTNTWKNRIIGDNTVFKNNPFSWTTAPFRIEGQPVVKSGLTGEISLLKQVN